MSRSRSVRVGSFSRQIWTSLFVISVTLLLLLGWSFLYLEPGTPSYVIGQVSAIVLLVTVVGTGLALYSDWDPF